MTGRSGSHEGKRQKNTSKTKRFMRTSVSTALAAFALATSPTIARAELFVDVAAQQGLTYSGETYGASWGDVNGDGRPDLWLGNGASDGVLYVSDANGGFVLGSAPAGMESVQMYGASWADFDNDGDLDLLVTAGAENGAGSEANQLFVNDGGVLSNQAVSFGLDYPLGRGRHATWLDWNEDGYLDVALINNNRRNTAPHNPSTIFTYDPSTQTFVAESWTIHKKRTTGYGQLLFSNDAAPGQSVLLVAHDKAGFPDGALTLDAAGPTDLRPTFAFPAVDLVLDSAIADIDNDLSVDVFTVARTEARVLLQKAAGITDGTPGAGLSAVNSAQFVAAGDFDNDKDIDFFIVRSDPALGQNVTNQFYANQGDGTFVAHPTAQGAGGASTGMASGLAVADYNADGFLDLLVTNSDGGVAGPIELFENQGNGNHWITLDLQGTQSNRDAIGAVVRLTSGGLTQVREVNGGVHRRSQDQSLIHFGLGADVIVDAVEITWPSGIVQTFTNLEVDQALAVVEAAPSSPNAAPVASITLEQILGTTSVVASGVGSVDIDGAVVAYSWDFGDGNLGSGLQPTHSYELQGMYNVTLTVTDDRGASAVASASVIVQLDGLVLAVGANSEAAAGLLDRLADRSLDLTSSWSNTADPGASWFTIDLGEERPIEAVELALRGDVAQVVEIYLGNSLDAGQVPGFAASVCSFAGTGSEQPNSLQACAVMPQSARYVTVKARTNNPFVVYGFQISESQAGLSAVPVIGFSAGVDAASRGVLVTASASGHESSAYQYAWDFGDGSNAAGETAEHSYAASGDYRIELTVTDSEGVSTTVGATVSIAQPASIQQIASTVHAVGANPSTQANLIDTQGNGTQNLSTRWLNSNNQNASAWFTLDLGSETSVSSVMLAPRGNLKYTLDVYVGSELSGGRVSGAATATCIVPAGSTSVPAGLTTCELPANQGRYITIAEALRSKLLMYGVEVFGTQATAAGNNPSAEFSYTQLLNTSTVNFDGSSSSDADSPLTGYVWEFGDGAVATGSTSAHSFASGGDFFVSLAVTDTANNLGVLGKTVNVTPLAVLPQFVSQPQSVTKIVGQSTTFSAVVDGSAPMSLQWMADGQALAGATGTSLTVEDHQLEESGTGYTLEASNAAGVVLSEVATLTVIPDNLDPVASFTFDPNGGFNPALINFDGSASSDSDGSLVSFSWSFGDGGTSTDSMPSHTFLSAGEFMVSLTVTDDDGATNTVTQSITIEQSSDVVIVGQPQDQAVLVGESATFSVTVSSTPPLSYQWRRNGSDVPGATSDSLSVLASSLADDGDVYDVVVSNAAGSATSATALLQVNTLPIPSFTLSTTLATLPFTLEVDASASTDNGSIVSYTWSFGDGGTAEGALASYDYSTPGTYSVTLTVTDDRGDTASLTQMVTVNAVPVALFTVNPNPGLETSPVSFDGAASFDSDGQVSSYLWTFGDGTTASGATATHTYSTAGTYEASLQVTDNNGAAGTVSQEVIVNDLPIAVIDPTPADAVIPATLSVSAANSTDAIGGLASFAWDFGDGSTASGITASHTYPVAGNYTIRLTVTDVYGASTEVTRAFEALPPVAPSFTQQPATQTILEGGSVEFSVAVSGTAPFTYQWLRNGTAIPGAVASTYSYSPVQLADNGASYSVNVTNAAATVGSSPAILQVNTLPVPAFSLSTTLGVLPFTLMVDAGASSDDGSIVSYSWAFGDGATAEGSTASHDYTSSGEYSVTLTVTDNQGASAFVTQTVIANAAPDAQFSFTPDAALEPSVVSFDAAASVDSDGTIESYSWNFGDGSTASGIAASHTFATAGTYTATLQVVDNLGASSSFMSPVIVNDLPVAAIEAMPEEAVIPASVDVSAASSVDAVGGLASFAWDFGDGQTGVGSATNHTYTDAGTYTITLTVTDIYGASSTSTRTFIALPPVAPSFTQQPQSQTILEGQPVVFTSAVIGTAPFSYQWLRNGIELAGANSAAYVNSAVQLADQGATYSVRVTNAASTIVSVPATLTVTPLNLAPSANISAGQVGNTLSVAFDGTGSADSDGSIVSYSWSFGDGQSSMLAAPVHQYAAEGSYSVSLTVVDDDGASSVAVQTVDVQIAVPAVTVAAAGANLGTADLAIDRLADGSLDLATFWVNDHTKPTAWITLDLGSSQTVGELRLAPRGDREYLFDVTIGDVLEDGQVPGFADASCVTPDLGQGTPTELQVCSFAGVQGRYVTVSSRLVASLRLHGIEVGSGVGNLAPEASFTVTELSAGTFAYEFDASGSTDSDGQVVLYNWDFGDGNIATGQVVQHTYSEVGTYQVVLSAVDNSGDTGVTAAEVVAGAPAELVRNAFTVHAAGSRASTRARAADLLEDSEQNLSTHWTAGSIVANAWITFDLGSEQTLAELSLAPRRDRNYTLDIYVGSQLQGDRVMGSPAATCSSTNIGIARPTELYPCEVQPVSGRYVTVASRDAGGFRLFGAEAYVENEPSGDPIAEFSVSESPGNSLARVFDASASTDFDGSIVGYAWSFGDGASGTGQNATHTYATSGTYTVVLTVTDDSGLTATSSQEVFAGDPPTDMIIPASVSAAGFNALIADRIVDELAGEQNLSSFWKDGGRLAKSWFTLDLGSTRAVTQLFLAPRNDRTYTLEISIGDALSADGEVVGASTATCDFVGTGNAVPQALTNCAAGVGSGRYITVRNLSSSPLRMYGSQVWAAP